MNEKSPSASAICNVTEKMTDLKEKIHFRDIRTPPDFPYIVKKA